MKKVLISLGFAALTLGATAQVKIKDGSVTGSSTTPNTNAILELESNNKGLLYPSVALTSTSSASPLSAHVQGMTVYNTATAGSGATAVTPGFYYNNGTNWVQVGQGSPNGSNWRVFGSTATPSANGNPASNTDSQYVMGRVAIGTNTAARVAADTSGSTAAQRFAMLTVAGGDANINGATVGIGGGQISSNTAVGVNALYSNTTGINSTAIGSNVLLSNTTGTRNVAVGVNTLQFNTTGSYNNSIGVATLNSNTTGSYNTGVGGFSLQFNTTGRDNTAVGDYALLLSTTGNNNIALGDSAGYNLTAGNNNLVIGYNQTFPNATGNYQLNIGGVIYGTGVDSTVLRAGNIGINTTAPNSSFQVNGSQSGSISLHSSSYTLTATDYTVIFTATATATLPSATGITGRIYRLVNQSPSATLTTSSIIALNGSTVTSIPAASAMTIQSDGTNWRQIQ